LGVFFLCNSYFLLFSSPVSIVGKIESLWRYPVKSMRGEELDEIFASYAGVYGDRLFAFESSASPKGFPFFTGREQRQMIRYRPRFRNPEKAARPINSAEAESSGANPISANASELMIDVETPDGKTFSIDDPALIDNLRSNVDVKHELKLLRSDKAITDCRPLSIFAVQTAKRLGEETGVAVDKRRFRANVYLDLTNADGFAEDQFVGRSLRIGSKVTVAVLQRDARCMMVTLDPDTAEKTPAILKAVAQAHEGMAGVYGAVLAEGMIRKGDPIELL
jgi:MOSC domain-containing protein